MYRTLFHQLPWPVLLWLSLAGCGRSTDLVLVEGVATLDGQPLTGATVILIPEGLTGRSAFGTVKSDGSFRLVTSDRDGASPASYTVIVGVIAQEHSGGDPGKDEHRARQKGGGPVSSTTVSVPPIYGKPSTSPLRCTVPVAGKLILELHGEKG
jgi:hypothetical protein